MGAAELALKISAQDNTGGVLDKVSKQAGGLGSALGNVVKAGALAGGAAIAGIGIAAVKMGADFDGAMREVNTLVNLNQADFEKLSGSVLTMSRNIGVDAVDATKGLYQAISAGVPADNAVSFLEIASKAAIGGVTDTLTAVDGLTSVLNAFKMPAEDATRVADVMFTTVKQGKTTFGELSANIFNVAPIAQAAGVAFEEVSAAIATVTKQGVPTSVATTQIRAAIQGLLKPGDEMTKIMKGIGYESAAAAIKGVGLQGALQAVTTATGADVGAMQGLLGSVEAVGAALGITGVNADMFAGDLAAMQGAAGASDTAFNEMNKSFNRQLEKLQSGLKTMLITIGGKILPVLTPIVSAFADKLPAAMDAAMGAIDGLAALVGPVFEGIKSAVEPALAALEGMGGIDFSMITGLFEGMADKTPLIAGIGGAILAVLVPAFWAWATSATAAATATIAAMVPVIAAMLPVIATAAAIGAAVAGLKLAWDNNFLGIRDIVEQVVGTVTGLFDKLLGVFSGAEGAGLDLHNMLEGLVGIDIANWVIGSITEFQKFAAEIQTAVGPAIENVQAILNRFSSWLQEVLPIAFEFVRNAIATAMGFILGIIRDHWGQIQGIIEGVMLVIQGIITIAFGLIQGIITMFLAAIAGDWNAFGAAFQEMVKTVWEGVKNIIDGYLKTIKSVLSLAWDAIKATAETAWGLFKDAIKAVWEALWTWIGEQLTIWKTDLETAWNAIKDTAKTVWEALRDVVKAVWDAMWEKIKEVAGAIERKINEVKGWIQGLIDAWERLKEIIRGVLGQSGPPAPPSAAPSEGLKALGGVGMGIPLSSGGGGQVSTMASESGAPIILQVSLGGERLGDIVLTGVRANVQRGRMPQAVLA